MGLERIQLESAEFNREFHVASPDRRWAFDVLPQPRWSFCWSRRDLPGISDLSDHGLSRLSVSARRFNAAIAVIEGILSRLPASLVQELQGTSGATMNVAAVSSSHSAGSPRGLRADL